MTEKKLLKPTLITIVLRSLPENQTDGPETKRLAMLLKAALRRYGFRCVTYSVKTGSGGEGK
jgi:hypothetical protein